MFRIKKKARAAWITAVVALVVIVVAAVMSIHESADSVRRSAVMVECDEWGEVNINGKTVFYFPLTQTNGALMGLTMHRDSAVHRYWTAGCWVNEWPLLPSCHGRVATVMHRRQGTLPKEMTDVGEQCRDYMNAELKTLRGQTAELKYYLRVHGVQDEGYQRIAAIAQRVEADYDECRKMKRLLDSVGTRARFSAVCRHSYTVAWRDTTGHVQRTPCRVAAADKAQRTLLLQTTDGTTPSGVSTVALLPWNMQGGGEIRITGYGGLGVQGLECDTVTVSIVAGRISARNKHDIPDILASDGSATYTVRGLFVGLKSGDKIIGNADLHRLFGKEAKR